MADVNRFSEGLIDAAERFAGEEEGNRATRQIRHADERVTLPLHPRKRPDPAARLDFTDSVPMHASCSLRQVRKHAVPAGARRPPRPSRRTRQIRALSSSNEGYGPYRSAARSSRRPIKPPPVGFRKPWSSRSARN
jgi:hypothetical protein